MARKQYNDDDGRTVVDMNVEGMPNYLTKKQAKNKEELQRIKLTRKERKAITKATYMAYLPMFLCICAGFAATMLIIWLWLKQ